MKLFNAEENKKNAGEAGAVKVILKVLSAYIEDSDVCKIYCSILDRMISNGKSSLGCTISGTNLSQL